MGSRNYIWEVISLELSGNYFEYSGTSSREHSLVFANVGTERMIRLSGDVKAVNIFNRKAKQNYFIGEDFDDSPIQFEAEVVTDTGAPLPRSAQRKIEKWLFHRSDYRKLFVETDYDTFELIDGVQKRLYLNCRFIQPQRIEGNGGVVGYRFTVECDSCMAWQEEITKTFDFGDTTSASNNTITVEVDSDLSDYLYPKVTILMGAQGGDISIVNHADDSARITGFVALSPYITLVMKGDGANYVSGENYLKFQNRNFIRLLDGENTISITGDVSSISFTFQNRRYL